MLRLVAGRAAAARDRGHLPRAWGGAGDCRGSDRGRREGSVDAARRNPRRGRRACAEGGPGSGNGPVREDRACALFRWVEHGGAERGAGLVATEALLTTDEHRWTQMNTHFSIRVHLCLSVDKD